MSVIIKTISKTLNVEKTRLLEYLKTTVALRAKAEIYGLVDNTLRAQSEEINE